MNAITIVGAGEAGLNLVKIIRERNKDINITLIDKNKYFFDKKELISKLSFKTIDLANFSKENEIIFINDVVERINPTRRKIYFKNNEPLDCETLIIATGLKSKKLAIKGEHKEGFFYFSEFDIFKLRDFLKIANEITIYISTFLGIKLSLALSKLKKEIRVLGKDLNFLEGFKEYLLEFFKRKNILVNLEVSLEEIIGNGSVKAVKISPLKVFSSQLVLVDNGFLPCNDFFEEEVIIKDTFFSNFDGLYFLGDVARENLDKEFFYFYNQEEAKTQASVFANFILENKLPSFNFKEIVNKKELLQNIMKGEEIWQNG